MNPKVKIITTTFNNQEHIHALIKSCAEQTYTNFELIVADDGSTDYTNNMVEDLSKEYSWIRHLRLPHGERGLARFEAIKEAKKSKFKYLLIIDSDMKLQPNLLNDAVNKLEKNQRIGALVIKEIPTSIYDNTMTRIKLFERKVINNAHKVDSRSVEAARFWREDDYLLSGGINPVQISFEEIQPTIRYKSKGGIVERLTSSGLYHDEKKVTLRNLLMKKKYHFEMMPRTLSTEENGFFKAFKRWYFFRPVLYQTNNILLYFRHPLLTLGMIGMYILLTLIGVSEILKQVLITDYDELISEE